MIRKHLAVFGLLLGMFVLFTSPTFAQTTLTGVWVHATCQGYDTVDVQIANVTPGATYTVTYNLTVACAGGSTTTIQGNPFTFTGGHTRAG
jgi:hypothetical protein